MGSLCSAPKEKSYDPLNTSGSKPNKRDIEKSIFNTGQKNDKRKKGLKELTNSMSDFFEEMRIDKETLKNKECTLVNLAMALKLVFDELEAAEGADLVLAIGNTGCGKSTMLTSIVYGPGHLMMVPREMIVETNIVINKQTGEKKTKKVKRNVLDQSDELRAMNIFKIISGSGSMIAIDGSEEKVSVSRSIATMSS